MKSCCPHRIDVTGAQTYSWRGQPVLDIRQWAKEHQEPLIHFRYEVKRFNPYMGREYIEVHRGIMPKSWFENLMGTRGEGILVQEAMEAQG